MSGFTDALTARTASLAGTCRTLAMLTALPDETRPEVEAALADEQVLTDVLVLALADVGVRISGSDIAAHRDHRCPCTITTTKGA